MVPLKIAVDLIGCPGRFRRLKKRRGELLRLTQGDREIGVQLAHKNVAAYALMRLSSERGAVTAVSGPLSGPDCCPNP